MALIDELKKAKTRRDILHGRLVRDELKDREKNRIIKEIAELDKDINLAEHWLNITGAARN